MIKVVPVSIISSTRTATWIRFKNLQTIQQSIKITYFVPNIPDENIHSFWCVCFVTIALTVNEGKFHAQFVRYSGDAEDRFSALGIYFDQSIKITVLHRLHQG